MSGKLIKLKEKKFVSGQIKLVKKKKGKRISIKIPE
jgi:hypothetical protein